MSIEIGTMERIDDEMWGRRNGEREEEGKAI
jgi:hypothetical protein